MKKAHIRNQISLYLNFGFPSLQNCAKINFCYESNPVSGVPELPEIGTLPPYTLPGRVKTAGSQAAKKGSEGNIPNVQGLLHPLFFPCEEVPFFNSYITSYFLFLKGFYLFIDRWEGREKKRAIGLTGNGNRSLLFCGMTPNQLSHTSQG